MGEKVHSDFQLMEVNHIADILRDFNQITTLEY